VTIVVSGIAACTPVGLHAAATCAAFRAGLTGLQELATFAVDGELFDREPMVGGRAPTEWREGEPKEETWPGHLRFGLRPPPPRPTHVPPGIERILELASIALDEIRSNADFDRVPADRIHVYLGLNETDPTELVVEHLRGMLGGEPSRYTTDGSGRAAGLALVHRAVNDLSERRIDGALVGGLDSLIRHPVARCYDRLHRLRARTAPEGFLAGEAAGFVFLEPAERAQHRQRTIFAQLAATAIGAEPTGERHLAALRAASVPGSDDPDAPDGDDRDEDDDQTSAVAAAVPEDEHAPPNLATGLTDALRAVRADAKLTSLPLVVCDLNGERPRALEWALACTRALGDLHGRLEVWHPAECIGDAGAAAGIVDLVWASVALQRGYAPRSRTLVWGASDGPLRAAAVLAPYV
jgi:3-oxoacyl-[acyl-carrier-protein] synthase-1